MSFKEQLQERTKRLAVSIIKFCDSLPKADSYRIISRQLIRAVSSVAANYRSVSRAKSSADFVNKLSVVEEEADETIFWLELLRELDSGLKEKTSAFMKEMNEIISIIVTAKKTIKKNRNS